jgi:hypothetical protein
MKSWAIVICFVLTAEWSPLCAEETKAQEPFPCPEATDVCFQAFEQQFLSAAGSLGLELDSFLDPAAPGIFRVAEVVPYGPSDGLGIEAGDWILAWDDLPLAGSDPESLRAAFEKHLARLLPLRRGQRVKLELLSARDGGRRTVVVVAGPAPPALARRKLAAELRRRYGSEVYSAYRQYLLRQNLADGHELEDSRAAKDVSLTTPR